MLSTITELNLAGKTDIKHIIMTIKCMITGMRNAVKEVTGAMGMFNRQTSKLGSQGKISLRKVKLK